MCKYHLLLHALTIFRLSKVILSECPIYLLRCIKTVQTQMSLQKHILSECTLCLENIVLCNSKSASTMNPLTGLGKGIISPVLHPQLTSIVSSIHLLTPIDLNMKNQSDTPGIPVSFCAEDIIGMIAKLRVGFASCALFPADQITEECF